MEIQLWGNYAIEMPDYRSFNLEEIWLYSNAISYLHNERSITVLNCTMIKTYVHYGMLLKSVPEIGYKLFIF